MIAWFIAPYKRLPNKVRNGRIIPRRYCAMDDFTAQITADGGSWREIEVLGDKAIVKVSAAVSTIATINGTAGFVLLTGKVKLTDTLSDLTAGQKTALRNLVLSLGYTAQEISNRLGSDLGAVTLGDVLRFIASRRVKPRYDEATDTIVFDTGITVTPDDVQTIDKEVQ